MEKGRRGSETGSLTARSHESTSSRFHDSFQGGMFHSHESLGSEENKQIRLLYSELLSAAKKNIDSQRRMREGKSWVLADADKNYDGQQDAKLASPFLVYTENKECSFPAKRNDFEGEMAAFESAAQAVSKRVDQGNNFKMKLGKYHEQREDLTNRPAEKRRRKDALEDDQTSNGPRERDTYWERRKKNNASAKKSRDARKTRELQTQIKAAFLERENLRIHAQLMIVQQENACLKRVLCAKM